MNRQHPYHRIALLVRHRPLPPSIRYRRTAFLILLAAWLSAQGQTAGRDSLGAAFNRYQSQTPQEKLFVHIDRTFYLAGETIWFKLYDIDGQLNHPAAASGIAYIEVLDRDQRPVLQAKVKMENGKGDGAISIPLSIPSGEFLFRAYTSWMRNFSPEYYYMQPLTIFNTLKDSTSDSIELIQPAYSTQSSPSIRHGDTVHAAIRLFPEGGNLVAGLESTIALETLDDRGKGIPCEGAITAQNKDTVARFHTEPSGIGKFTFTPAVGTTYFATTRIGAETIIQPLPTPYKEGYVMHLNDSSEHRIRITVHSSGRQSTPVVYLLIHTRGQLKTVQMNFLSNDQTSFYFDKDSLGDGISHLTIFNGDRIPVCERLYFRQPKQQLHIGVTTANPSPYPTRSRVAIGLSTSDNSGNPLAADLSMSVFRLDSLQPIPDVNILDWLLLCSDLKGPIDLPRVKDWATNPAAAASLDDLMLTRGWSRFRWEDLLLDRRPLFDFLPETNGPVITGKVTDKRTGVPPNPQIAYLSVPGRYFKLATALTQPDGNVYFHLDNFYGTRTLIAQTNSQTDSNGRLEIPGPWSDRFAAFSLPRPVYSLKWSDQLLQRTIDAQAENAYLNALRHHFTATSEDTTVFYGTADLRYNLDDYVRFVTMEEVIQEFVENVRIRRKAGRAYFRVKDALFNLFFDDDPLLLIDGIPVFNADKLVTTDPARIERIDVVSHKYILGPSVSDGIVSFKSYDGEFAGYELDPNALAIQYTGLDRHREFYTPVYDPGSKGQPSIPDFRNELLWAPDIVVDSSGRQTLPLYTSDLTGEFALIIQGITKDGLAGYSIVTFSVNQ